MTTTRFFSEHKDPADVDYYEADVDAVWLDTETITNATFVPDGASGLTVGNVGIQSNIVRAQMSGGNIGTYPVEITVTTSGGRIRQRTVFIVIRNK